MSQKLTDWFTSDVKPVHVGCYEVDDKDDMPGRWYAYWDGSKFCFRSTTPNEAFEGKDYPTMLGKLVSWRGLAVEP